MADLIGRRLGNYEITGLLGEGGMASVYRARQLNIRRDVAIKIIGAELLAREDFTKRFEREAETIASLNHTHILKLFDYGQHEGLVYLVIELLPGGSLAERIRRTSLSVQEIERTLTEIASALDYAHQKGIIHRDLKPQNVLFDESGGAHLTDFGIAKLLDATTALTQTGIAMGTPLYMSPEQCRGGDIDARSDIYSLGIILFEMLAGKTPFRSDTPVSLLYMHLNEPPPSLRATRPDLPEAVDLVIAKALAKTRDARYQSAGELAMAFKDAVTGKAKVFLPRTDEVDLTAPVRVHPGSGRGRRGILAFAVVLVLIAVAALALFLTARTDPALVGAQATETSTFTSLPTQEATYSASPTPVAIVQMVESTATHTMTEIPTIAPTDTVPPTATDTLTATSTRTPTTTDTATFTLTWTPTATATATFTATWTPSATDTATYTLTYTATATDTATPTASSTATHTATPTLTPTHELLTLAAETFAARASQTAIIEASFTKTLTPTASRTPDLQMTLEAIVAATETALARQISATCDGKPAAQFEAVWPKLEASLGCPGELINTTGFAYQNFASGKLVWAGMEVDFDAAPPKNQSPTLVLFTDNTWKIVLSPIYVPGKDPTYFCPELGSSRAATTPKRGFSKVLCLDSALREKLGKATGIERGDVTSFFQKFQKGFLIHYQNFEERRWLTIAFFFGTDSSSGSWEQQ